MGSKKMRSCSKGQEQEHHVGGNLVCCFLSADVDPMQTGQLQRDLKKVGM